MPRSRPARSRDVRAWRDDALGGEQGGPEEVVGAVEIHRIDEIDHEQRRADLPGGTQRATAMTGDRHRSPTTQLPCVELPGGVSTGWRHAGYGPARTPGRSPGRESALYYGRVINGPATRGLDSLEAKRA